MPADAARCDAANTEDPNREAVAGRAPPEEQDVVDLVFMEYYLADFVTTHGQYDGAKFTGILAKSAK